jgi:hypothetical protein
MSRNTLLLTYTGRRSGKEYSLPIGYLRKNDLLITVSARDRLWWRNFRGGAPARMLIQGKSYAAIGEVIEEQTAVVAGLAQYVSLAPRLARFFKISLLEDGTPDQRDLVREAGERVLIHFRMLEPE